MATHVDRDHIHNHFVWGAADVETHKRYHSNKRTYHDIRDASDRLCEEYSLSVIVPRGVGKSYTEYHAEREGTSWKAKLRSAIDAAIIESADYDDLLRRMESRGYEIKQGAHISFRAHDQQRFTRAKTLGGDYAGGCFAAQNIRESHIETAQYNPAEARADAKRYRHQGQRENQIQPRLSAVGGDI